MGRSKKARNIISNIKKSNPSTDDIKSFASAFIELMAECGISPKIRSEFYQCSKQPTNNLDKLIDFAEDTIGLIEEKN